MKIKLKISNKKITVISIFLITTTFSQLALADNRQCEEVMDTLYGYKWFYKVFGMITGGVGFPALGLGDSHEGFQYGMGVGAIAGATSGYGFDNIGNYFARQ